MINISLREIQECYTIVHDLSDLRFLSRIMFSLKSSIILKIRIIKLSLVSQTSVRLTLSYGSSNIMEISILI